MIYVIAILVFCIDQFLKWEIRTHMLIYQSIPVLPPALYLEYIRNPGGAFSIFPHQHWLFVLVALIVIGVIIMIDRKWKPDLLAKIGLGLVLGGALGNMADRVISGTVVDYVYFRIINFPVFNAADVAIDAGVILLLIRSFRQKPAKKNEKTTEDVQS